MDTHNTMSLLTRLITIGLIVSLAGIATAAAPLQVTFEHGKVVISQTTKQTTKRVTLDVEVANTPPTRALGLMHRTQLDDRAGMLFLFDEASRWSFWMKNTLIPLSIAFIDARGQIVDIQDMKVAPSPEQGPFEFYQPKVAFQSALEMNQGFFAREGIKVGAKVSFVLRARMPDTKRP